jgi:DNA-binding MarR family transcriptional regulator
VEAAVRLSTSETLVRHIERTCRMAIDGRLAARALAGFAKQFELTEGEFQLLWALRSALDVGLDQTTLAGILVISPAHVSATVERARLKSWVCQQPALSDRRRHLWRLTSAGHDLVEKMIRSATAITLLPSAPLTECDGSSAEAAA